MRSRIVLGLVVVSAAAAVWAADKIQPLNIKTGRWEVHETVTASGEMPIPADRLARMTPEQRAKMEAMMKSRMGPQTRTWKRCVTRKDLNTDPFTGPDQMCTWTVLSSTGNEMEARGTSCRAGRNQGMKSDFNVKVHVLDSENVKGSGQATTVGNGHTMNMNFTATGKWIGATCPAGTN